MEAPERPVGESAVLLRSEQAVHDARIAHVPTHYDAWHEAAGRARRSLSPISGNPMSTFTIAGHAGRIAGTTIRVARQLNSQIDWREVITITALGLVTLVLMTYEAGRITGATIHRLNDWLAREWVSALGLLERPAAPIVTAPAPIVTAPAPIVTAPASTVWAPAPVFASYTAPTGMARAVALVRCTGCSQRQAAKRAGVSRTQLQRALAAA